MLTNKDIEKTLNSVVNIIKERTQFKDGYSYLKVSFPFLFLKRAIDSKLVSIDFETILKSTNQRNLIISIISDNFLSESYLQPFFKEINFIEIFNSSRLTDEAISSILEELNKISLSNENVSSDLFSQAYMFLISNFQNSAGQKSGEFHTPDSIASLLPNLLEVPKEGNCIVSDITSGMGTLVSSVIDYIDDKSKLTVVVQELEPFSEAVGLLNFYLKDIKDIHSFCGNTISDYKNKIGTFQNKIDFIVANPPFGLTDYGIRNVDSTEDRWKPGIPKKADGDFAFLLTIRDLLAKNGKAAVVLPLGTTFKDSTADIRKFLIAEDLIEGIINCPANLFQTTSIPVVIWILNKNKSLEDQQKVFMINAEKEFEKVGNKNIFISEKTSNVYRNRTIEKGFSDYINNITILDSNANLSVQRYIYEDEEEEVIDILSLNKEIRELKNQITLKEQSLDCIFNQIERLM